MSAPRSDPALVALRHRIAAIEGDHGPPLAALPFGIIILQSVTAKGYKQGKSQLRVVGGAALLAGVLARFGLEAFAAAQTALPLVLVMLAAYLLARKRLPRLDF